MRFINSKFFFSCIARRMYLHKRYLDSQLDPGTLTTPGRFCLVLLRSRPDTVHRFPSHETRIFNVAYQGQLCRSTPSAQYHPCYSGLQVQGTASTPAARDLILQCFLKKVNGLAGSIDFLSAMRLSAVVKYREIVYNGRSL